MRKIAAVAFAATLVASVAAAQYKQPAQPNTAPQSATTSPVKVEMVKSAPQPTAEPTLESAKRIERAKAIKMVKENKAIWVDVRSKESYDAGHIKGAISIPLSELMSRLRELPPHKFIITYCA